MIFFKNMETPPYLKEFITLVTLHGLVLISPGSNFALVAKNSLTQPRKYGLLTAFGIALGTAVYVGLALFFFSSLLALTKSRYLFLGLKYAGALYLVYLGVKSLFASRPVGDLKTASTISTSEAVRNGLFNQLGNYKATLFFMSLFTQVVDFHTPLFIKLGYGVWMFFATFAWFGLVTYLLSKTGIRERLREYLHWINRAFGLLLVLLGVALVL